MTGTQAGIGAAHTESRGTILAGGIALVGGAVAFLCVFSYLAARFHYLDVLDGSAHDVLPALLATGTAGRAAWAIYGVLPLVFIRLVSELSRPPVARRNAGGNVLRAAGGGQP